MSELIYDELHLFGICFLLGVFVAAIYDVIRILRLLIPHKDVVVDIEDLSFWMFTAWIVFRTLFTYNHGMLRAYAFFGMFIGVIIYALTVSRIIMYLVHKMIPYWKGFFKILGRPFKIIGKYLRKKLKNMSTQVTIAFKGR